MLEGPLVAVEELAPPLEQDLVPGRVTYRLVKRGVDVAVSAVVLALLSPLMAAISIAIRLDSPGPALFHQRRIGKDGNVFTIHKFRSMVVDAPAYSYKVPVSDPRITRVGRWLRMTGLDELPQLWNVLWGDMSLIGPRPELPNIVNEHVQWHHPRLLVRPGITGWWQIHHRDDVPLHLNVEYDVYYLQHFSFGLDWQIACRTVGLIVGAVLRPR